MGAGDEIMAAGMARGAAARGKQVAFGDGRRIIWGPHAEQIFRGNPNVARRGSERASNLEWVAHYAGHRLYNRQVKDRWVWNYYFKAQPGELFFDEAERKFAESIEPGFVLIEPNVPAEKSVAPNKQWPVDRFQIVADRLTGEGHRVVQLLYGARYKLERVKNIKTSSFREALVVLSRAALYVGHEGGTHHGAAALSVPGVVIFGGFIPPEVTGYQMHINLSHGGPACGSLRPCSHCSAALKAITADHVYRATQKLLPARAA